MSHAGGLNVLLAGPDGAGKSTLADYLVRELGPDFALTVHVHWRPYVLPQLRLPSRRIEPPDGRHPHARAPHSRGVSLLLLTYHWLDFFVAGWGRLRRTRTRGGLVLVERGWWDLAVDSRRYRLRVPRRAVLGLGKLLPSPDLVLVLDGPGNVIAGRKRELSAAEVARQAAAWCALSVGHRTVVVDAGAPLGAVQRHATASIRSAADERRRGEGEAWVALPGEGLASSPRFGGHYEPRWWLPRRPRAAARASLVLYQPVTAKGVLARDAASALAFVGGFRVLPRRSPPPPALRRALQTTVRNAFESIDLGEAFDDAVFAVARCNWPGKFVVLACTAAGAPVAVAKVGVDDAAEASLQREALNLDRLARFLPPPLSAPRVRTTGDGVLVLVPEHAEPPRRPDRMRDEVAVALGRFFRAGVAADGQLLGFAHGDASPWNLLQTERGWLLLDWEHADEAALPFHDLFHFLVHGHSLLGRPAAREILAGLEGTGWVARAIAAYATGAAVPVAGATGYLNAYLERSLDTNGELVDAVTESGRAAYEARRRLRVELSS